MKLKLFTLISTVATISPFVIASFSSCQSKEQEREINELQLYSDFDTLKPGQNIMVKAVALPGYDRINDGLLWSIEDTTYTDGITIDTNGTVNISTEASFSDIEAFTVKVTLKKEPSIFATMPMGAIPSSTSDFIGFQDNVVRYRDRYHQIKETPIETKDGKNYVAKDKIDLFVNDSPEESGPFSIAPIWFMPIMSQQSFSYMKLSVLNNERGDPSITGNLSYVDNTGIKVEPSQVNPVPSFSVGDASQVYNSIVVRFACDPSISLTINFVLWQERDAQNTQVYINNKIDEEDKGHHDIHREEQNMFRGNFIYDSSDWKEHSGIFHTFAYRQRYEYLDFTFELDYAEDIDDRIKNALNLKWDGIDIGKSGITFNRHQRSFDAYQWYQFDIEYSFNNELNPKDFDDAPQHVADLYIKDPIQQSGYVGLVNFGLEGY